MKINIKKMIEKIMEDYKPINYRTWILGNQARQGINIKRLGILTPKELRVFNESIPYQDARNDPGHAELTAYFAIKLLDYLPGKREIVVPASICHDIGWYGNDPEAWGKLVKANKDNLQALESEELRRPHQNRGCLKMGIVFERAKYPFEQYHNDAADIVGDHDTRTLPTTDEGRIVRSSDFLWRACYPHAQIYMADFNPDKTIERIEETCIKELNSPLGPIEKQIARIELANTIFFKFPNQAEKVLKPKYEKEFKKVRDFYKK